MKSRLFSMVIFLACWFNDSPARRCCNALCLTSAAGGAKHRAMTQYAYLQVALGGALGASARYATGLAASRLLGKGFPWGTLIVNVAGGFLMGVLVVALLHLSANRFAPLLMTGVLGGFTTFSAFALDAVTLYERGQLALAAGYVLASVILSILALFAGLLLARSAVT
jgi:CrcB protein